MAEWSMAVVLKSPALLSRTADSDALAAGVEDTRPTEKGRSLGALHLRWQNGARSRRPALRFGARQHHAPGFTSNAKFAQRLLQPCDVHAHVGVGMRLYGGHKVVLMTQHRR